MVLVKMLMEIDPLTMRGSMVMTMVTISPSRRAISAAKQLAGALDWFRPSSASKRLRFVPKAFL